MVALIDPLLVCLPMCVCALGRPSLVAFQCCLCQFKTWSRTVLPPVSPTQRGDPLPSFLIAKCSTRSYQLNL